MFHPAKITIHAIIETGTVSSKLLNKGSKCASNSQPHVS